MSWPKGEQLCPTPCSTMMGCHRPQSNQATWSWLQLQNPNNKHKPTLLLAQSTAPGTLSRPSNEAGKFWELFTVWIGDVWMGINPDHEVLKLCSCLCHGWKSSSSVSMETVTWGGDHFLSFVAMHYQSMWLFPLPN